MCVISCLLATSFYVLLIVFLSLFNCKYCNNSLGTFCDVFRFFIASHGPQIESKLFWNVVASENLLRGDNFSLCDLMLANLLCLVLLFVHGVWFSCQKKEVECKTTHFVSFPVPTTTNNFIESFKPAAFLSEYFLYVQSHHRNLLVSCLLQGSPLKTTSM